jgi:hypothetical protein
MSPGRKPARLPPPHTVLKTSRGSIRFYLADSIEILQGLTPGSISAIVTSPPYNLGIRYRTYEDSLPNKRFLSWTGRWIAAAARALAPEGSLFLNVGAKPTDPWTAMDVAQAARAHLTRHQSAPSTGRRLRSPDHSTPNSQPPTPKSPRSKAKKKPGCLCTRALQRRTLER